MRIVSGDWLFYVHEFRRHKWRFARATRFVHSFFRTDEWVPAHANLTFLIHEFNLKFVNAEFANALILNLAAFCNQ